MLSKLALSSATRTRIAVGHRGGISARPPAQTSESTLKLKFRSSHQAFSSSGPLASRFHTIQYTPNMPYFLTTVREYATAHNKLGKAAKSTNRTSEYSQLDNDRAELVSRKDSAFDLLRDMDELEKNINGTIKLPMLGDPLPKELEQLTSDGKLQPILLTPQRVKTIQRFATEMQIVKDDVVISYSSPNRGLILSGPNGQGKSVLSYLLACTAYANNCVLVYIPLCSEFVGEANEDAAVYFLERLELFNSELLEQIPHEKGTLAKFISTGKKATPIRTYSAALKALKSYRHRPVVYVLDEHNEIWKLQKQNAEMFRKWVVGSGVPHGRRTYVIYSGSAHSRFELSLQSNMHSWKVNLQPLAFAAPDYSVHDPYSRPLSSPFVKFVTMGAFTLAQPLEDLLNGEKTAPEKIYATFDYLFHVTKGNPREVRNLLSYLLHNWTDPTTPISEVSQPWGETRQQQIYTEIIKLRKQTISLDAESIGVYHNFLGHFFGEPEAKGNQNSFADLGLVYHSEQGVWQSTSLPAQWAMLQYYFDYVVIHFTMNHEASLSPGVLGYRFQALVIRALSMGRGLRAWQFANPKKIFDLTFKQPLLGELRQEGTIPLPSATLFIPTDAKFPYWDCVYHEPATDGKPHRVVFIQTTVSTPKVHETGKKRENPKKKSAENSVVENPKKKSVVEKPKKKSDENSVVENSKKKSVVEKPNKKSDENSVVESDEEPTILKSRITKSLETLVPQIVLDLTGCPIECSFDKEKNDGNITVKAKGTTQDASKVVTLEFVLITWAEKADCVKQQDKTYQHIANNLLIVSKEAVRSFVPA